MLYSHNCSVVVVVVVVLMLSLACIRQSFHHTSLVKRVACIAQLQQRRHLNRVLFDLEEVLLPMDPRDDYDDAPMIVRLQAGDGRAMHIRNILKLKVGEAFRCGVLNVGMTNHAAVTCDGSGDRDELTINLGRRKDMYCNVKPAVDIILATPRPQKLERLIPIISCLGVGSIILIDAKKVVKDYFGTLTLRACARSCPIHLTRPVCIIVIAAAATTRMPSSPPSPRHATAVDRRSVSGRSGLHAT